MCCAAQYSPDNSFNTSFSMGRVPFAMLSDVAISTTYVNTYAGFSLLSDLDIALSGAATRLKGLLLLLSSPWASRR